MTWFKYFYDKFFPEFFIGEKGIGKFFVAHFLLDGQEVDKEKINKNYKGKKNYPPKIIQNRFDFLFNKLKPMHA